MSMATAAPPTPEARRQVRIAVRDKNGNFAAGASVDFYQQSLHLGGATVGDREVTISYPSSMGTIEVVAKLSDEAQSTKLESSQREQGFQFSGIAPSHVTGARTARCADGSSGQPCVNCTVGGKPIRICA